MIVSFIAALTIISSITDSAAIIVAHYTIQARLDTSSQALIGTEIINFRNPTDRPLEILAFHLYPNAFADTATSYCREDKYSRNKVAGGDSSSLTLSNIQIDGREVSGNDSSFDGTVLYVDLPVELEPNDSLVISLDFRLKLSRIVSRVGYDKYGNFLFAHWFPILCGYQHGRLIDWEHHANSEFFSNFANFDVSIEIPSGFRYGSTGDFEIISEDSLTARYRSVADTVIDFAFVCGPNFQIFNSDTLGVKTHFMLQNKSAESSNEIDMATKLSLAYCSEKLFDYPYHNFVLVDMESGALGMELPGMIIMETPSHANRPMGKALMQETIAHEIIHQWFYGIIATNEFEEAYLDEGITEFLTRRLLEDKGLITEWPTILGYKIPNALVVRFPAILSKARFPSSLKSWEYPRENNYYVSVYNRAALALETISQVMGKQNFELALRDYAVKNRFRHPTGRDLYLALQRNSEIDLSGIFEQFIHGTARVDYAVISLSYKRLDSLQSDSLSQYKIELTVGRELDGILPQKIRLGLQNGNIIDTTWNGIDRTVQFEFIANAIPDYAIIDPEYTYPLDENRLNNSIRIESWASRLISFEWDFIFILELFLALLV